MRPTAHTIRTVTEDMIEEERLVCDEPVRILCPRDTVPAGRPRPRGTVHLSGNVAVWRDEASGEIREA